MIEVDFMLLAEDVQLHSEGGFDITRGGINTVIVGSLPFTFPKLCVAYSLRIPWEERARTLQWMVTIITPPPTPTYLAGVGKDHGPLQIAPEPQRPTNRTLHLLSLDVFTNLLLEHEGEYTVLLMADNEIRGEVRFFVIGTWLTHKTASLRLVLMGEPETAEVELHEGGRLVNNGLWRLEPGGVPMATPTAPMDTPEQSTHMIAFSEDAYRQLEEMAGARRTTIDEVLRSALSLRLWADDVLNEGGEIIAKRKHGQSEVLRRKR